MANPIEFAPVQRDTRDELKQRIERAPVEHAAAVLSAYELLEELHRSGTLDLIRGAVGARSEIVTQASSFAAQPESVRTMRNLLVLGNLLSRINPDLLHRLGHAITAAAETPTQEPPSLLELLRRFNSPDSRRALATAAEVLEGIGRGLTPDQ